MSRRSENVEDQRGMRIPRGPVAAGGGGLLIILVIVLLLGGDPTALLETAAPSRGDSPLAGQTSAGGDNAGKDFVAAVLGETEDVWGDLFSRSGSTYRQPKLVLFSNAVQSACGFAESAVGPFYCPGDEKVYLDMAFFRDLSATLDAPGDFAQAYVIAHEVGHHVQNLLGITGKVHGMRGRVSEEEYNRLSVKLELQADFLAGVWAHHAHRSRQILESGDIEEALNAASAIGDDRLQRRMQGYVVPDAFTHGSSDQRVRWFRKGLETGDPSKGDTFGTDQL
jgi:predicted metalloprotease